MKPLAPVFEGAGRRWAIRHLTIATVAGIIVGEAYWHFYELPRRRQRDEYYKSIGVEWKRLV